MPLEGAVETVVYFGTDTLFHLRLPDGRPFVVRSQNKEGSRNTLAPGTASGSCCPRMPCRCWLTDAIGLMTTEVEIVPIGKQLEARDRVDRRTAARRWLLLGPAVAVVTIIGVAPMAIILVYSFLRPGYYGGVEWTFNFENYVQFLFTRDLFDETLSFDPAYLAIFGPRPCRLAFATLASLLLGFPTAYYIATRSRALAQSAGYS